MLKYSQLLTKISEKEEMTRADYKVSPSGRKSHKYIVFKDKEDEREDDRDRVKEEVEQLDELGYKTLQSYRQGAHTQMQHYKYAGGKDKPEASSVLAKREAGHKVATDKVVKKDKERIDAQPKREPQKAEPYKPLGGRDEKSGRSYSEELVNEGAFEKAEENKRSADAAKKYGNTFDYHLHMADHHDNMAEWHGSRGRHGEADKHAEKGEQHHELAMKHKDKVKKEEVDLEENHLMDYRRYTQAAKNAKAKGDHDIAKDAEEKAKKSADNYKRVTGKTPSSHEEKETSMLSFKEIMEKMNIAKADMGDVIKDFQKSDAPQFAGKSDEKKRQMAIAAKLEAERGVKEELKGNQHKIDKNKNGKVDAHDFKLLRKEEEEIEEQAPVAPSLMKHRISVTVSDPDHTMVSKRKEKIQKTVIVTHSDNKDGAKKLGEKFYKKKGYIVHDSNHVGMVNEELDEGIFDSLKKGYVNGLKSGLKQKIKPEHHKSYNIDDVKSTSDATSILQKAKQAGHAHQVKEEVEQVDEGIFDSLKKGYVNGLKTGLKQKIKPEHHDSYNIDSVKSTSDATSILQKAKQAGHAHQVKEEVEQVDEGIFDSLKKGYVNGLKTGLKQKIKPEHHDSYNIDSVKSTSDATSILQKAKQAGHAHQVKEEVDQIDELSKGTLRSYINKAGTQVLGAATAANAGMKFDDKQKAKLIKRGETVDKAVDKYRVKKENVEQIDEVNHREFAQAGKVHPTMAQYMKSGQEIDFYHSKTGDKISGKVTKNDGKNIHVQANKGDKVGGGDTHKFAVSKNLGRQMHEGVDMPMTYKEFMEAMWPGTPEYEKKFPKRVTGAGARHDIVDTGKGVKATRRFNDNDTAEAPKTQEKRGRGRPAGSKSGANQKVTTKSDESGGMATHSLRLPSR